MRVNGAAIRAIRVLQGKSAGECARQVPVDDSTWLKWERGVAQVSPRNFLRLVEILALDDRNAILAIPEAVS